VEHELDEHPGDPASVAFELSRWEDDWRLVRHDRAASVPPTVSGSSNYLTARMGWAGAHHLAFDEFAADVAGLLRRLEQVTSTSSRPQVGAPCFDCGADLLREYGQDHYRCPRCHRDYDDASYWLAVRADLSRAAEVQA